MMDMFDFNRVVDRHGSWCTQWDFVADRFGVANLLPFTISDMDFATAPCILDALQQRVAHGVFGYSRWQHDDFLAALQHWMQRRFSTTVAAESLVYGPSVIYMVAQMLRHWTQPGDEVLIHTPAYDAFYNTINGNQRRVLELPLQRQGNSWLCDMAQLETLLARPQCKVMLLCSPHNPTGKVWQKAELQQMSSLCERYGVKVISDEIHMDMVLGSERHTPWSEVAQSGWALFTSASKSFNIPALTGAWGIIPDATDRQAWFHALKQQDGLSSPAVMAVAATIAAYREGAPWLDALRDYLKQNMQHIALRLNGAFPDLDWQPPAATYLAWIDLNPLGIDEQALQQQLIHHYKVAIMPGSTYGEASRGYLRLNAGCPRSKLDEGLDRLLAALHTG
ncbi:bifunctional beta-cystathionase/maltose regulon regulatory protein [Pantoea rodasii]|uniref:cysteine-S-conjugate beta-lyase n=3 Tax=Erwiniaceae TaxID=1903409 RepID=A0A0U3TIX6_9GAMM|nr:bifunctional beta-cystathionase/maltose regulon regulatory protein [Pantoea vagans]KHJ68003.1 bifunctional beta-cystathionase/maltose regulon regulatory protein [Pantoea rodasii]